MSFYEWDRGSLFDRDRGTSYDRDRHVLYEWDWGILLFVLSLVIFAILDLSISGSESISIRVGKHRDRGNIGIGETSGLGQHQDRETLASDSLCLLNSDYSSYIAYWTY